MENFMKDKGIELREEQKIPLRSIHHKDIFAMLPTGCKSNVKYIIF